MVAHAEPLGGDLGGVPAGLELRVGVGGLQERRQLGVALARRVDADRRDRLARRPRSGVCLWLGALAHRPCMIMERRQPLRLLLDRARGRGGERRERVQPDPAVLVAPGAGDHAVDQERGERLRRLGVEDPRPVLLGQQAGPARVDEQRRVPGGQEARRRGRVRIRQRAAGDVEQLLAGRLRAERPQLEPPEHSAERREREAREARDVLARGGAEAGQVAAHEQVHRVALAHVRLADPVRRGRVEVRAPALPGARRWDARDVEPLVDAARALPPEQRLDLGAAEAAAGQLAAQPASGGGHRPPGRLGVDAQQVLAPRGADGDRQRPVVGARDEVDRRAHQRALHDLPALERAGEGGALEALEPRPQADVHRRRVLGLDAADALQRVERAASARGRAAAGARAAHGSAPAG